jgi:hypothetical protein
VHEPAARVEHVGHVPFALDVVRVDQALGQVRDHLGRVFQVEQHRADRVPPHRADAVGEHQPAGLGLDR